VRPENEKRFAMGKSDIIFNDGEIKTVLMDSISYVDKDNHKDIIVSGSHGGTSSAGYGLDVKVGAAFFNDAGIGKNRSGISGLDLLQEAGIIAIGVSHETAEIANGQDIYENGIVSFINECAENAGIKADMTVKEAVSVLRSYLKDS
jgi:hypothetical protein